MKPTSTQQAQHKKIYLSGKLLPRLILLSLPWLVNSVAYATSDFGDAPDPYRTTSADNGASHTVVSGVALGNA
ncbi:MAG: Unknown protein, partial [uncultured Thiotrichaceae bacterium]